MESLDKLLFSWLTETDAKRFEIAYARFFKIAFIFLVQNLDRQRPPPTVDTSGIAQETLLKFYKVFGADRLAAACVIDAQAVLLEPLAIDGMHNKHVRDWKADIKVFRDTERRMLLAVASLSADATTCKALIPQRDSLTNRGYVPIADVRSYHKSIQALFDEHNRTDDSARPYGPEWRQLLSGFVEDVNNASGKAESKLPGVCILLNGCLSIVEALPELKIPSTGYLIMISRNKLTDQLRSPHYPPGNVQIDDPDSGFDLPSLAPTPEEELIEIERQLRQAQLIEDLYAYLWTESGIRNADRAKKVHAMRLEADETGVRISDEAIAQRLGITRDQVRTDKQNIADATARFIQRNRSDTPSEKVHERSK